MVRAWVAGGGAGVLVGLEWGTPRGQDLRGRVPSRVCSPSKGAEAIGWTDEPGLQKQ